MTKADFYAKYGNVKVKFSSYYKYTFSYSTVLDDGKTLSCEYGGNHDQIYRHDVDADAEVTVSSLEPYAGTVRENGKEIDSFYEY